VRTALEVQRSPRAARDVALLDLLDRLLEGGVVIQGEITLAAADIDLVDLSLRLVVGSVGSLRRDLRGPLDHRARS
jgi:Gas vesicle protein